MYCTTKEAIEYVFCVSVALYMDNVRYTLIRVFLSKHDGWAPKLTVESCVRTYDCFNARPSDEGEESLDWRLL